MAHSSPPPPSFHLPPLNSSGQLPLTPSPTPSPTEEQNARLGDSTPTRRDKGKRKEVHVQAEEEAGGRVSMYVRLFDEMIATVLTSEEYLFDAREAWILRHILSLPYEPRYILTRLLLRRPAKIHPLSALQITYSPELGEEGVRRAMLVLAEPLNVPQDIQDSESNMISEPMAGPSRLHTPLRPARSYPTPTSLNSNARSKARADSVSSVLSVGKSRPLLNSKKRKRPWADLPTGLTAEEEKADPELAEAIRESLWATKIQRIEVDEDGREIATPPPVRPNGSRSASDSSTNSSKSDSSGRAESMTSTKKTGRLGADWDEPFSLQPDNPPPIDRLGKDERDMTLEEIMSCIPADELRKVARARQVPLARLSTRAACEAALCAIARSQTTLAFTPVGKSGSPATTPTAKSKVARQATLPFAARRVTSETLLISTLLPHLSNHALQLSPSLHSLIARVNLIYTRTPPPTTTQPASLMLPSILVQSHKRRYPDYGAPARSRIWESRGELLLWERAVYWETKVSDALGENWADMNKSSGDSSLGGGAGALGGGRFGREMLGRLDGSRVVKRIWEGVEPIWREITEQRETEEKEGRGRKRGLCGDRFEVGHVLTRIMYKGASALSMLHEYDLECEVLRTLLGQRRWRRGKRGAWYDRLALVLMNHYNASPQEKEEKCREATQVCIDGLLDEDTHLIYRPSLSRRLTRLERKLQLPADECHISYASLLTCETRELAAPRVPDNMGQPKIRRDNSMNARDEREASLGLEMDDGTGRGGVQQTGKSVWLGRDGEVTVEGWVLEWWEAKGYKGFHSESSILTTLFTLLLWPVLFHPVPGAFETPYQTAPLDLGEDTFAPSRAELFEAQLKKISTTAGALEVLAETDERERDRGTWAVGVNWEYGRDDLLEIVRAMGGGGVQGVCRMLGEEYRHRVSGVPDLIVWDPLTSDLRFVEVKGPGDQLSETQKVWIDVLLSSGIQVEVCRVKAVEVGREGVEKAKREWAERAERAEKVIKAERAERRGKLETDVERAGWKEEYEADRKDAGGVDGLRRGGEGARGGARGTREGFDSKDEDEDGDEERTRREEEGEGDGWEGVEETRRAIGR